MNTPVPCSVPQVHDFASHFAKEAVRGPAMACFHIRWSNSQLDWECHTTHTEAELRARELAKPSETFSIERFQNGRGTRCPVAESLPGKSTQTNQTSES